MASHPPTAFPDANPRIFTGEFFFCCFSFCMLLVNSALGTVAIIGFLLPWAWTVFKNPKRAQRGLLKYWPLMLMPALAILSTLWSNEPPWTLRTGAELALTVAVGIIAGYCVPPRTLIASLLTALVIIAVVCVLAALQNGNTGIGGRPAFGGFYESKNAFSAVMSLLLLVAVSVLLDKGQLRLFRLLAMAAMLFTPVLLYLGQSVGAIVGVILTILLFLFARFLSTVEPKIRAILLIIVVMGLFCGGILMYATEMNPLDVLDMVGKDSTLTGRTYLWQKAIDFIGQRPFLGVGYRAFWRVGNPAAEDLWYYSHVQSGAGFNFHNEYLHMGVDLGAAGIALMLAYFIILIKAIARAIMNDIRPEQSFAAIIVIFTLLRTPLEVGIFEMFSMNMVLFAVCWIYLRQKMQGKFAYP